jgi:2,3,4,5-tetrahydropyridine-2-carboxylate N-succinyltransferase
MGLEKLKEYFESSPEKLQKDPKSKVRKYAECVLWYLDQGKVQVWDNEVEKVNVWVKTAILNYFRTSSSFNQSAGAFEFFDKLPVKKRVSLKGVRVVPGAIARYGSFIEPGCILMPSFVNVGAYVGAGTMVDTWATVGSCAHIGKNVHLSGGVGIGGVLEPAQGRPVIIEDGAFIGSRAIVVEGVRVGKQAVLGAGVVLTASTSIVDVRGKTPVLSKGEIPANTVVIPGTTIKDFPAGPYGVPCALIIGNRKPSTDLKTSLNEALREHSVAV